MSKKERVLVLARACPEKSRKYVHSVCVAGITQNGEWRRLYPFPFSYGKGFIKFKKKDIIEAVVSIPSNDKRKESRKVMSSKNLSSPLDDKRLINRILHLVTSLEALNKENASLGVIKPIISDLEVKINDTNVYDEQKYFSLTESFLERREKVKLPVEVRYVFRCRGEKVCKKPHKIIVIDWEVNELVRNVMRRTKDVNEIKRKIRWRFYDFMKKRDLYFVVGTHFKFPKWLIIGILYPKKGILAQKSIGEYA